MGSLSLAVYSRLDLVFFVYGLSFSAMGLLLFVQNRKESSFALGGSLWLLGWFGLVHGGNEFLEMWGIINPGDSLGFEALKFAALAVSYVLLLEFGRRAVAALESEEPSARGLPAWLLGRFLTPALAAAALLPAVFSGDFLRAASLLVRPLLCFPGALLAGYAFLGYSRRREKALDRLKARNYFVVAGTAFLAYAALGGLVLPGAPYFPADRLNADAFYALTGLPVQLFRAVCAVAIFGGVVGAVRIFREGALRAAQQELLDIIEFFPDATFVIDANKRIIAWNRALEHMTGVSKKEMLGKGDFAYSVPFYGHRRPILIDLIGRPDPEAESHYKYVRKRTDGAIYAEVFVPSLYGGKGAHVWVTASPLMNKDGSVYGAIESVRDVTDRKLAEQALHQSEAQYRALIETTNTGFLIIDKEGRVLDANQEYARLSGHAGLAEIRGRSVLEWTAPYEREKNAEAVRRCAADGCIRNFEIDYVDAAGNITPVELNATVVEIDGVFRILTLCRDITDRRRSEKQLRESEGKFRTLTEKSMIGVYLIQDGVFKYVNPMMTAIFGYGPSELLDAMGPQDLVLPEDWPLVRENLRRRLDGEVPDVNYSFRGRKKDGAAIAVEVFGSRIDYLGRPAVLGTLLDITERKKTQDALRESEEMYRSLVDNAQVGIVVHQAGVMKFVNRKMAEIVRVSGPGEVLGRSVLEFMHPDYREFVKERIKDASGGGSALAPAEEKLVAADGTVLDVEINSVPITYQGGRCLMAIVQDITARKSAEAELKTAHAQLLEANLQLEKRVAERTSQLAELNKELEAFSYSAAHDLKAPLRRLNIFSEALQKDAGQELKSEDRESLLSIRKAVSQMTSLVDGLLTLSTTGRKQLQVEPVNLSEVLQEALAEVGSAGQGRAVEWSAAKLPVVSCDRAMIRQALVNLLSNAAKYSRNSRPPRVEVLYSRQGAEHVIGVRDNGVGFSMEYYDKLFGVFQRLHRSDDFEGTGIGLSTVKRIVARHGGRVWAESEPGKGASFYFSLPADGPAALQA